jgi:hypothetical protein
VAGLLICKPENPYSIAFNVFVAISLSIAGVIAMIALHREGLPEAAGSPPDAVSDRLLQRVASAKGRSLLNFDYNDEDTARLMKILYLERKGRPAWVGEEGSAVLAEKLLHLLKRSHREALYPQDYGIERIESPGNYFRGQEQDQTLNPIS